MSASDRYSTVQMLLHWATALLILVAYLNAEGMGRALRLRLQSGETGLEGATTHVWLGIAVFALVAARLVARWGWGVPAAHPNTPALMQRAARWGHALLYVLMAAAPVAGIATWFGRQTAAGEVHEVLSNLLILTALAHALLAIWHQLVARDGTLTRMLRVGR